MTLSAGDRVDLKRRVSQTLGRQDWADIDLTLGEFGFSTQDDWNGGDRKAYVLEMLRYANDDAALAQLDSYLHPTAVPAAPPQPDAFDDPANPWSGTGLRLFLSHVSTHAEHAGRIRAELAKRSIDAFVAHDSISPTEEWLEIIQYALRTCDACLAFLSPDFSGSDWCDQEVGFCTARERLVIPVEYGTTPYGFLGRYQALPVKRGDTEAEIALSTFELLVRKEQSRDAMARALVQRWANTGSWDDARENFGFVRRIPAEAWTQQLVDEVWAAREQVHDLRTASIDWKSSDVALHDLLAELPFRQPDAPISEDRRDNEPDDEVPF